MIDKHIKNRVFFSNSNDPFFNLSLEDHFLRNLKDDERILLFYVNRPSIILGRFQNPWVECLLDQMQLNDIDLVRRQSGGGTVYHDEGNLNFSFIGPFLKIPKETHNQIIINVLRQFGIKSYPSNRSDIMLDYENNSFKFSGSAFKQTRNRSLHHGTLLINSNLSNLGHYLTAKKRSISSRATQSVRKSVINLSDINNTLTQDLLVRKISAEFYKNYEGHGEVSMVDLEKYKNMNDIKKYYQFLKTKKWRFDETPKFLETLSLDIFDEKMYMEITVKKGLIQSCVCETDIFHTEITNQITAILNGKAYHKETIINLTNKLTTLYPMYRDEFCKIKEQLSYKIW